MSPYPPSYAWAGASAAAATAAALAFAVWAGATVEAGSWRTGAMVVGGLAGLHLVYSRLRPDPIIAAVSGGLAVATWTGMMAGVISLLALRTGAPLIDPALARLDAAVGFHAPSVVAWTAATPWLGAFLGAAYLSSFPLLFAAIVHLGVTRRPDRVWELCAVFAATLVVCTLLSALVPAIGAFAHYGIPADTLARLPAGSGLYHLSAFEAYRNGAATVIDFARLQGVVTFPSIHTCLALATAYAYRGDRLLAPPMIVWNAIVLVSTIPIGGHYAVDLLAGALVWWAATLAVRARPRAAFSAARPNPAAPLRTGS